MLAALTLVTAGCGRSYHITGRVVVLPELQSAAGVIIEFTGMELPRGGSPLAGATVKMLHDLDDNDRPKPGSVWEHDTVTDENGFFDTSDYAAPFKESKVGLEISKDGYKTAYRTYIDYNHIEPQTFLVVLVPVVQSPGHK